MSGGADRAPAGAGAVRTTRSGHTAVLWFRRDLRTADHPALLAAVAEASATGGSVAPLFVVDGALMASSGANRRSFLAGSLRDLDTQVEGSLALRAGRPEEVVPAFAAEMGARTVFATGDTAPYGRRRDARVASALGASGAELALVGSPYAVSPGRVRAGTGDPYRVFTPFRRAWEAEGWPGPSAPPTGVRWRSAGSDTTVEAIGTTAASPLLPVPGLGAAEAALEAFLAGPVDRYGDERDRPDHEGTSRLSPYLRFGTLHPRQILARLPVGPGAAVFRSELGWREFYADVLWHHPRSAWEPFQPIGSHLRWDTGARADERFAAWAAGCTGFPLVDAGMRQLRSEGWMHNRVRMLTASFLVKDLHLDWRRGARLFLDLLVDGDLASNNHGWQWAAGTGTDAAPFHRVFNPTLQAERFDPDGAYVRRYVPEAEGFGYPAPIVDHAAERAEALRRWEEARLALALEREPR
jgi:deoxyribodipyrimidine photo-lyase